MSKEYFGVIGKEDEKLTVYEGEMFRDAEIILKCNQRSVLIIIYF